MVELQLREMHKLTLGTEFLSVAVFAVGSIIVDGFLAGGQFLTTCGALEAGPAGRGAC